MQFDEFREIIKKRASVDDEWYSEIEKYWKEMTELFSADLSKTIEFLNVCTADEFSWLSEVIEDIAKKHTVKNSLPHSEKQQINFPKKHNNTILLTSLTQQNVLLMICSNGISMLNIT